MTYRVNYIPVEVDTKDGKKSVKFGVKWQDYQRTKYNGSFNANGRAVICGETSDYLCGLDFDNHDNKGCLFSAFSQAMKPSLMDKLTVEETQGGGFHVYFRFPDLTQKKVLAKRSSGVATIELQASEKALLFCYPTKGYKLIQGTIETAPLLSFEEFSSLVETAMYFNEYVEEEQKKKIVKNVNIDYTESEYKSPADCLRGERGKQWTEEILRENGFTENGNKVSSNGFSFITYSHPEASNYKDVHLGLYDDHVFLWSSNTSKNLGLNEGAVSFYDVIKTIGYNNDSKAMAKAFFNRFPEFNNNSVVFIEEEVEETADVKEESNILGGYTKEAILYKIKTDSRYSLLKSHIETSAQNAPKPLEYSYLLTGLSLIGLCSYNSFYKRLDGNDDIKDSVETGLSFCVCAPPASGKESVKNSLTVYGDYVLDTSNLSESEDGSIKELPEISIEEFPDKSDRYIEKNCCRGLKNALYIKDEFQDILASRGSADSQAQRSFAIAKKLMTNRDDNYRLGGSSNFDQIIDSIEKGLGRKIDTSNWRLSLACFGTNNVYSSLASGDEDNGFCRRIIWNNEKMQLVTAPDPNKKSTKPRASKKFGEFLKGLVNIRSNQAVYGNGSASKGKANYPVVSLRWNEDAVVLYQDMSDKINEEYLNGKYNHNPILSYSFLVENLASIFAISRGEFMEYNPYSLPDDLGGEAFEPSQVKTKEVNVSYDDVDLAVAVFLISCNEFENGCSEFMKVSVSEESNRKLEESILKFLTGKNASLDSISKRIKKYSLSTVQKTIEQLMKVDKITKLVKPSGKVVYTVKQ